MARTASPLKQYMDDSGELPRDVLLGHIVLFTINDGAYDQAEIARWFDELMLNPAFVPEGDRPINAYKKATSEADEFAYSLSNGTTAHILVRDVHSDGEMVTRHMIREIKDSHRRSLAHDKIGEAVFYRPTNGTPNSERFRCNFQRDHLRAEERPFVDALQGKITAAYERYCNFMDGMKVRAMVRDYVKHLNAVTIKQGVYFVHVTRRSELGNLQALVERLGNGCTLQLVPLVDLAEQRSMVIEAFQTEAQAALATVVEKIAHVRSTRKSITPEAYAKLKTEYDLVINQATEYTRTLGISQERTAGAAEVALDELAALQHQMIEGASA